MPGFSKVIFAKGASDKLACIGDLADAGLVCVFDQGHCTTYRKENLRIEGDIFTQDVRDPRSRLYPIHLYRKKSQPITRDAYIANANIVEQKCGNEAKFFKQEKCRWVDMPALAMEMEVMNLLPKLT